MPNSRTARANDRSQLVSLKFMMLRWVSGPSEQLLRVGGADATSVSRACRQGRYYLLCRERNDRRPLRLARDDNRNSHTPETAVGARLMGRPSRRSTRVAPVSAQPARERSLLPAILQMPTCGLWGSSTSAWPTWPDPIPRMSRSASSRRFIACAMADRLSVSNSSMSLLPFDWGNRTHRRFVRSQMFRLEQCRG